MARKKKILNVRKRSYPLKVRLVKSNFMNKDKMVYNDIVLYSYKDVAIDDEKTFLKLNGIIKHLKIKESENFDDFSSMS